MLKTVTFQKKIWDFYKQNKRDFPWRQTTDPYKILISEVMLQQTQTQRVVPKYKAWIARFPDFKSLAGAPFSEVLKYWSGLGYNRRALYLHTIAKKMGERNMSSVEYLQTLPGIGKNTASAIVVFTKNEPLVFIETNIRRVFIHHFSPKIDSSSFIVHSSSHEPSTMNHEQPRVSVDDKELLPIIEATLDKTNPREWYYALMDYGSYLAKLAINPNRKSKHYAKQSKFQGSLRQVRGEILKLLLKNKKMNIEDLKSKLPDDDRFEKALDQLEKEGFIKIKNDRIVIKQ